MAARLHILESLGPMALMFTPLAPIAPLVIGGIKAAESIPGATGAQKRTFVQQIVAAGAAAANVAAGKTVIDPDAAANAAGNAIDTTVGITNMVHALHAPTAA